MDDVGRSSIARGFLFADLRGYSDYVERHGDRAGATLLTAYRDLVRRIVPRFSGAEIRTEGDSFYIVFTSPSAALQCGLMILDEARDASPLGSPLAIGIGVHAGETVGLDEGFVGSAVNIAARVCAAAAAGELLTTEAVRALTRTYLDVTFSPAGRRRLKGISEPVTMYRVIAGEAASISAIGFAARLRRRLANWPVAAGLVIVTLISSVLIATLIREGLGRADPADIPAGETVPSTSPRDSSNTAPDATATNAAISGAFPTEGEERLLALVEDRFRASCARAEADAVPMWTRIETGPALLPMPVTANVVCSPFGLGAPDRLQLWAISTDASGLNATELLFNLAGARGARSVPCGGELPSPEAWSAGPVGGHRLCLAGDAAVVYWTYDGTNVLGRAVGNDGDLQALLAWWNDDARFRRP